MSKLDGAQGSQNYQIKLRDQYLGDVLQTLLAQRLKEHPAALRDFKHDETFFDDEIEQALKIADRVLDVRSKHIEREVARWADAGRENVDSRAKAFEERAERLKRELLEKGEL